jgi:MFS transporter, DHA2 family, multidrug resistance protein
VANTNAVGNQGNQGSTQSSSNQPVPLRTWIGVLASMLGAFMYDGRNLFAQWDNH